MTVTHPGSKMRTEEEIDAMIEKLDLLAMNPKCDKIDRISYLSTAVALDWVMGGNHIVGDE